jgi:hypothetical protein
VIAEQRVPAALMQETLDLQARVPYNEDLDNAREFIRLDNEGKDDGGSGGVDGKSYHSRAVPGPGGWMTCVPISTGSR